jgi:hypothetical protein
VKNIRSLSDQDSIAPHRITGFTNRISQRCSLYNGRHWSEDSIPSYNLLRRSKGERLKYLPFSWTKSEMLFDCNCRVNYWVQLAYCAGAGSAAEVEVCISVSSQSVASEAEVFRAFGCRSCSANWKGSRSTLAGFSWLKKL